MKSILRTTFLSLGALALLLLGAWSLFQFHPSQLSAQTTATTAPLSGWIWAGTQNADNGSRQGMGWISLNCENDNSCAAIDHKVEVRLSDKTLQGYAWGGITRTSGPNSTTGLGWLKFGGLGGCPSGTCAARIVGNATDGWELAGWARACSVFEDPDACTGALAPNSVRGDWDGWVSLSCENHAGANCDTYHVVFNDNDGQVKAAIKDSTAWGDHVLGALSFAEASILGPTCATVGPRCSTDRKSSITTDHNLWCEPSTTTTNCPYDCNVTTGLCNTGPVTATTTATTTTTNTITTTKEIVRKGDDVTITWNITSGSCAVTGGGITGQTNLTSSGSTVVTMNLNQATFTLTCGGSVVDTVTVRTLPETYES